MSSDLPKVAQQMTCLRTEPSFSDFLSQLCSTYHRVTGGTNVNHEGRAGSSIAGVRTGSPGALGAWEEDQGPVAFF